MELPVGMQISFSLRSSRIFLANFAVKSFLLERRKAKRS
jgi:hypothetical protein